MEIFAAIHRVDPAAVLDCLRQGTDVNCPEPWHLERPPQERESPLKAALNLDPSPEKCEILSILLKAGASIAEVTLAMEDDPPLCLLARDGDVASLEILLQAGADFRLRGQKGSCLGAAVESLSLPTVQRLLEAGMRFPTEGPAPRAFVHLASRSREMLQLLMENGISPANCPRLSEEEPGMLDDLIWQGNLEQVAYLLSLGIEPDDTTWDETSRLLLCGTDAAFVRHLEKGPDLNKTYGWGERSLCELAVERDLAKKLELLFAAGQDPWKIRQEPPFKEDTLLHVAAKYGSVQCLELLLLLGHPVDPVAGLGKTPLMDACERGCVAAVRLLLAAGASVTLQNEFRGTALRELAYLSLHPFRDTLEIMKLLHSHGADLNQVDDLRVGIVQRAAEYRHHDALRWLVEQGTDLNLNGYGGTPLRQAVLNDDLITMEILLKAGADPNVRMEDDETVLFDVQSAGSVRLLLQYGADPTLLDDLFDRTAIDSIRDPIIRAAFPASAPTIPKKPEAPAPPRNAT